MNGIIHRKKKAAAAVLSLGLTFSLCFAPAGVYAADSSAGSVSAAEAAGAFDTADTGGTAEAAGMEGAGTAAESAMGNANRLYSPLTLTGSLLQEEEIFTSANLAEIAGAEVPGISASAEVEADGVTITLDGINLLSFLEMCSLASDAEDSGVVQFFRTGDAEAAASVTLGELRSGEVQAVFIPDDVRAEDGSGPISVILRRGQEDTTVYGLRRIITGTADDLSDPHYGFHTREPLSYMQNTVFTVNFVDKNRYPQADENAEAFRTITYTMKEIEEMMAENPDQVFGSYFGISGNEESKHTMGLGGFSDYFEGLSMSWLLSEKAGLKDGEGFAVFYGRDNDRFGQISDIGYFFPEDGDYSDYYLELSDELSMNNVVPVLAVSKNGYPLLPEHDHDLEGNVDYNIFNQNAKALGFETEIGLVKNVSGPFVAALANLDGVYGGYRNETSGDCIRVDLYVDASAYEEYEENGTGKTDYSDVPADSWYAEYVGKLTDLGIVNGKRDSLFEPQARITRAEFVKMIAEASGTEISPDGGAKAASRFDDVAADAWYAPYVAWAAEKGVVQGVTASEFRPQDPVTRQDMAVIICRCADVCGIVLSQDELQIVFSDAEEISLYAGDAAARLQRAGIIDGRDDGSFAPKQTATRAEACKITAAFMEQMESEI